jgi:hypothetical protein
MLVSCFCGGLVEGHFVGECSAVVELMGGTLTIQHGCVCGC